MWRAAEETSGLMAGSGPGSDGHALSHAPSPEYVYGFCYGVCVIRNVDECHILRFDIELAADMELYCEVGRHVLYGVWLTRVGLLKAK